MKLFTPVSRLLIPIALLYGANAMAQPGAGQDLCANVVPIQLGVGDVHTLSGNNAAATGTGDFHPDSDFFPFGALVMWHAFTITECMNISFNFCEQPAGWESWGFLFNSCPGLDYMGPEFNETDCPNENLTYYHAGVAAGTYYIAVPQLPTALGEYSFELSSSACGADLCMNVTPVDLLEEQISFTGDNTNATHENDWVEGNPFGVVLTPAVWHAINISTCDEVHITYCGTDPMFEQVFGFITNSCPGDSMIVHSTSYTCADGNQALVFSALAPGTYYIPVVPYPTGTGPYQLNVLGINCTGLSVAENESLHWSIFPNPAEGTFNVMNGAGSDVILTEVIDLSGRVLVTNNRRIVSGATLEIPVSRLAAGVYVVRATNVNGQRSEQRLVIQ